MKQNYKLSKNIFSEYVYQVPPKILIILNTPWSQLPKEEISFLDNILRALQHSLACVQIMEYNTFKLSKYLKSYKKIIGFGVTISNTKLYEWVTISADRDLLLADTLTELLSNEMLKKKLWTVLQTAFRTND